MNVTDVLDKMDDVEKRLKVSATDMFNRYFGHG